MRSLQSARGSTQSWRHAFVGGLLACSAASPTAVAPACYLRLPFWPRDAHLGPAFGSVQSDPREFEESQLKRLVGSYKLSPKLIIAIALKGDQLWAQLTGQPAYSIFSESEFEFFLKVVDAQLRSEAGADSQAPAAVVLHQNGRQTRALRIGVDARNAVP